MPRHLASVLVVLVAAALSACASTVEIRQLMDDPSGYDGENVRIEGEVTQGVGITGLGGGYQVDDGTGELVVVSRSGAPREGAVVRVEGVFRSVFNLDQRSLSILEESDREVR